MNIALLFLVQSAIAYCIGSRRRLLRVFGWFFIAGAFVEFATFQGLIHAAFMQAGGPLPDPLFPLTFLYARIWPVFDVQNGGVIDISIRNELRCLAFGIITSGTSAGLLGVAGWRWLGGEELWMRITSPIRNANRAVHRWWHSLPDPTKRTLRLSSWLFYGSIVGLMVAGGWWRWFGPVVSLAAAVALFALIALIALLDSRRSVPK